MSFWRYHVAYRVHHSEHDREYSFQTRLERELFVVSILPYVIILREWATLEQVMEQRL